MNMCVVGFLYSNSVIPKSSAWAIGPCLVWVLKPNVDLKICMYDRLYQDSILVHTR